MAGKEKEVRAVIVNEQTMILALRDHFHAPEYVILPHVRNGAGFSANRTADALCMSVWPSRGLHLYGVEIKVSRSDWLREMRDPKKADDIGRYCDFWVLAAGSENIVGEGELPAGWGLLIPGKKPGTLQLKKEPVKIEHTSVIDRSFLAAILKKAFGESISVKEVEGEIQRRVNGKVAELEDGIRKRIERDLGRDHLIKRNTELEGIIKSFQDASGCHLWSEEQAKRYGRAMKVLSWDGIDGWIGTVQETLKSQIEMFRKIKSELPE